MEGALVDIEYNQASLRQTTGVSSRMKNKEEATN
jgi:hypothetical protein